MKADQGSLQPCLSYQAKLLRAEPVGTSSRPEARSYSKNTKGRTQTVLDTSCHTLLRARLQTTSWLTLGMEQSQSLGQSRRLDRTESPQDLYHAHAEFGRRGAGVNSVLLPGMLYGPLHSKRREG